MAWVLAFPFRLGATRLAETEMRSPKGPADVAQCLCWGPQGEILGVVILSGNGSEC